MPVYARPRHTAGAQISEENRRGKSSKSRKARDQTVILHMSGPELVFGLSFYFYYNIFTGNILTIQEPARWNRRLLLFVKLE